MFPLQGGGQEAVQEESLSPSPLKIIAGKGPVTPATTCPITASCTPAYLGGLSCDCLKGILCFQSPARRWADKEHRFKPTHSS